MTKEISQLALFASFASAVIGSMLFFVYFVAEPVIGHGQEVASSTFYIRQTITDESSFAVPPVNVNMVGAINGVTGGSATGTTQFVVQSNNASGYTVEIDFFDNGTEEAMLGDVSDSEAIRDYDGDVGVNPSVGFQASTTAAMFAYTVQSTTTSDTADTFFNNGAICGTGGSQVVPCWKAPSTTAYTIVDTDAAAVTGATSTIYFHIDVPSGATPVPQAETYTATATLSLFVK